MRSSFRFLLFFICGLLYCSGLLAASNDALAPLSAKSEALALPLHTVTVSTHSLEQSLLFYRDGLGLAVQGPLQLSEEVRSTQRALWGLNKSIDWDIYLLTRAGVEGAIQIRLLLIKQLTPTIHASWSALELGPFSMGFPNLDQQQLDLKMRQLGFGALNTLEQYTVPRPDGSQYAIEETIFNGPDFVHAVGIHRGDGMSQLGPVDLESGVGGPAYAAMVVDDFEPMLAFMTDVLGMELRSDRTWKSAGSEGALNVPDGTVFRFSIVYSKGATSGHMLFVDYQNISARDNGIALRPPNRGIGMWTFPVVDLDKVMANAGKAGVEIVHAPVSYQSPSLGKARVATVLAPNGFLIELFESQ